MQLYGLCSYNFCEASTIFGATTNKAEAIAKAQKYGPMNQMMVISCDQTGWVYNGQTVYKEEIGRRYKVEWAPTDNYIK